MYFFLTTFLIFSLFYLFIYLKDKIKTKRKLKLNNNKYTLISFKIINIENLLKKDDKNYIDYFYSYIENIIKNNLRKGDVLIKNKGNFSIISKSNIKESYYISLRLKKELSVNKLIGNNIYFSSIEITNNYNNNINDKIIKIDKKIEQSIKKSKYITLIN